MSAVYSSCAAYDVRQAYRNSVTVVFQRDSKYTRVVTEIQCDSLLHYRQQTVKLGHHAPRIIVLDVLAKWLKVFSFYR